MSMYAYIPARTNSKRVPGKNYKNIAGHPLVWYTMKAALEAKCIDQVFVSVENKLISEHINDMAFSLDPSGSRFNVLLRPEYLAQDHVQTDEVFIQMLRQTEKNMGAPDYLCLLQPTSPMRTSVHIDAAWNYWNKEGCLLSAVKHEGFFWRQNANGRFEQINGDPVFRLGGQWTEPREKTAWRENGAIYMVRTERFSLLGKYRHPPYSIFEMTENDSADIDTPEDWQTAKDLLWNR